MPGRKMLHDVMSVSDIYSFAEPIMEMLRENYGAYDADVLDEVMVEEPFVQHLAARGYDVRAWADGASAEPTTRVQAPAAEPVVPVTVVRTRRGTPSDTRPSPATERPSSTTPIRARRVTPSADGTTPTSGGERSRASGTTTRSRTTGTRASAGSSPATKSDSTSASADSAPSAEEAPRTSSATGRPRRVTRTPRTGNNGSSES